MAFLFFLFNFNFLLDLVVCYNLETSHPIIYESPGERGKAGYFGTSVAIRPKSALVDNTWTIQVGAPRSNPDGESVPGPGTVYRCRTYGPCKVFGVDRGMPTSGGYGIYEYREKKDAAWIGVAMDVENFGSRERSVVCGHRWMNEKLKNPENIDITYLVTGVCYLQDLLNETHELPVQRLLPLVNKDKIYAPKPYVDDLSTYHWGLGQAGLSVRLIGEPLSVLIGAPGVTHWIGSVVLYDENLYVTVGNFAKSEVARKNRYTYLGYSVAFGRFYKDGEVWYVAGAPRSGNYRGEVFTFQFKGSAGDVRIQSNLAGATFGEYFGASLAVADLNGDGYDDLVVGAPLFSSRDPDEGRIYVYLGTGQGNFLVSAQVINGRTGHGRFGSCVTSVKDLDQDGYDDVAVGAPFEDDQKGSIYIYRGFSKGLQVEYSQRISGQDIHPHLRGFGVSISPAVDIDGNKYFDVVVGSHLSGHAVLLRSRPVISIHPKIKTESLALIDRRDSHFNVTVCLRYSGSNAPDNVGINRIIEVDPVYGRGTLDRRTPRSKIIRLRANQIICELHPIILTLSGHNYSPLQVTVKTEVEPCGNGKGSSLLVKERQPKEADGFQKACPVGSPAEATKEIAFAGICGSDFTCRSDLEISCDVPEFRGGTYTLGSSEFVLLSVGVKNHGEPAQDARIKIWSNLKLKHRDEVQLYSSERTHWIDIEGFLSDSYKSEFPFQIDLAPLTGPKAEYRLNLAVEIFTTSLEENLNNNICKFSILLLSDAVVDLRASSSVSSVYITGEMLKNQTFNATHYYEVQKTGTTPVKDAELTIHVPFHYKEEFLSFEVETAEWMHFSYHFEESTKEDAGLEKPVENCPPTNRTLFLNCSTPENDCKILRIFFTGGIPTGFSSYVKIIMTLNVTAVDLVKNEKDIVYLSTIGILKFSKFLEGPTELQTTASISLFNEERDLHVAAHVIALSILAGGFLLSLIITGLVRSNFFKRAKKQELQALKDAEASFVYFATGPNLPTSC